LKAMKQAKKDALEARREAKRAKMEVEHGINI
jgi:hypothetical protein